MSSVLLIALVVCAVAAISDWLKGTIPNRLTYSVLALSPVLHSALGFARGLPWEAALLEGGYSLMGMALCSVIPLTMWRKNALGGGDAKLFAALGALLQPRLGFEVQVYVITVAALLAPVKLAYAGVLLRSVGNLGALLFNPLRSKVRRRALDPALAGWFRLGPCFLLAMCIELALRWRQW